MSKKILSAVLAIILTFSVIAVSAFAVTAPAANNVGIYTESDATVGQSSGTVKVKVYWVFPADRDFDTQKANVGNIVIGYNTSKYTFVSGVWGSQLSDFLISSSTNIKNFSSTDKFFTAVAGTNNANLTANDKAYGYDGCLQLQMKVDATNNSYGYTGTTGFPVTLDGDNKVLVAELTFSVKSSLTANDAIGCVEASLNNQTLVYTSNGKKNTKLTAMVSGVAVPAAATVTYKVTDKAQQVRHNPDDSTKFDLGFVGSFKAADIDPDWGTDNVSKTIEAVGVEVSSATLTTPVRYETTKVYVDGTDGYQFRAIISGIDRAANGDSEITVKMYVKYFNDDTLVYSKGVTTTLNQVITRAEGDGFVA